MDYDENTTYEVRSDLSTPDNPYYTMIGSRKTPSEICVLAEFLAMQFALEGRIGRSGNAKAMDEALTKGIIQGSQKRPDGRIMGEVFLPKPDFRDWLFKHLPNHEENFIYTSPEDPLFAKAQEIASAMHPNWDAVVNNENDFGLMAHTRNPFQILGRDLETVSDFVILYAEPVNKGKAVKGGTNTAYQLALHYKVRTYNLFHKEQQYKALDYLGLSETQWLSLSGK